MENFPKMSGAQVAIMRADSLTGHVLDENFKLAIDSSQKVYTIVDSFDKAMLLIESFRGKTSNVEFVIYGEGKKVLKFVQ
jgi:hypothetical protein